MHLQASGWKVRWRLVLVVVLGWFLRPVWLHLQALGHEVQVAGLLLWPKGLLLKPPGGFMKAWGGLIGPGGFGEGLGGG